MGASEIRARAIAEDVMAFADGGDSVGNGIASRSELEGGLEGTKYDHFKGWMFARGGKRFMKYDDDGSGTISVLEMQLVRIRGRGSKHQDTAPGYCSPDHLTLFSGPLTKLPPRPSTPFTQPPTVPRPAAGHRVPGLF